MESDTEALPAQLHERLREAENAKIELHEAAADFLWQHITLRAAPALIASLPCPLERSFPHIRVADEVFLGAACFDRIGEPTETGGAKEYARWPTNGFTGW
jgi:hypothetical protein